MSLRLTARVYEEKIMSEQNSVATEEQVTVEQPTTGEPTAPEAPAVESNGTAAEEKEVRVFKTAAELEESDNPNPKFKQFQVLAGGKTYFLYARDHNNALSGAARFAGWKAKSLGKVKTAEDLEDEFDDLSPEQQKELMKRLKAKTKGRQ